MGKAFDRVIEALHTQGLSVRMRGQGKANAQAPGHSKDDLSVVVTDVNGQVLVHSHSDPTDEVLATLGLSSSDLFDEPSGMTYNYPDGRKVHRSPTKVFRQSGNTKGQALYHADRIGTAETVWVVEGEKDVHALESCGQVAVCNAGGAGKLHLFDLTPLHGKNVRVVRDMDEPGLKHVSQLVGLLTGKAHINVFEPAVGKDAADHIAAGQPVSAFTPVRPPEPEKPVDIEFEQAVDDQVWAERVRAEARRRAASYGAAVLSPKLLGEILDLQDHHEWLIDGLIERRDRLVLTGGEGAGKSYLSRQIIICAAAGIHPLENRPIRPSRVLVVDAENSEIQWARNARYVTRLAVQRGSANPGSNVLVSAGVRLDFTLQADIDTVHKLIDQHKPDLLYIGPLYKLVPKAINSDDDAAPLIAALDTFRERGLALVMEAHAGHDKSIGGDRSLRPRGSAALMGWPEFGFGLRPTDEDPDMVSIVRWRGDREQRDWPQRLRRGVDGEMPWMPA